MTTNETRDGVFRDLMRAARTIIWFIAAIWIVTLVDTMLFGGRLQAYGIWPRAKSGLPGIVCAPFLHGGIFHLIANTSGLLVFGGLIILRSEAHFWVVTIVGVVVGGFGTWLFGRPAIHIGASGVIFAYFGYLLCVGWFERRLGSLALSVVVFLVWGYTLFGILPLQRGISWEGHLFGLLGGAAAARILARPRGDA